MKVTFRHEADNNKHESITDVYEIDPRGRLTRIGAVRRDGGNRPP